MARTGLSERERQILELASAGYIDQAIANELGISVPTVSTYWCRIREKLGPKNRAELVATFVHSNEETHHRSLRDDNERLADEVQARLMHEQELSQEVATFEALLDGAPEPVLIVDADGVIQKVNRLASDLFGWQQDEMVGMRIGKLMPESLHEAHRRHRKSYLAAMPGPIKIRPAEGATALKRDGSSVKVEIRLNATDTPTGRMIVCFVRPYRSQVADEDDSR